MARFKKVYRTAEAMQEKFEELGFLEPELHGYEVIWDEGGIPGSKAPEDAVSSHTIIYREGGRTVARAHAFLRIDGSIAASGMPDPKRILEGDTLYILELPDDGDP